MDSEIEPHTLYAVFHSFMYAYSKQHAATTVAQIKYIIGLLKKCNTMSEKLSTLWVNIYGCTEHYRCATAVFLLSIFSQDFYVFIDLGVSVMGRE